jgi:hypothetical protein
MYLIAFISLGVAEAAKNRSLGIAKSCIYKSYLSIYNPAFRLGCELAKDRTN